MPNDNFRGTTLETCPATYRHAFHRGWAEAQTGARYCPEYDRAMTNNEQIAYECGRLVVVNVIAAAVPIPRWDGWRSQVGAVNAACIAASVAVGPALPGMAW